MQSKENTKTLKRPKYVNIAKPVQSEPSMDGVHQVNLIEKTQQVNNSQIVFGVEANLVGFYLSHIDRKIYDVDIKLRSL